ncbi:MAG TPA: hypothetical protein VF243_04685, partial [Nitrosospira sp.]
RQLTTHFSLTFQLGTMIHADFWRHLIFTFLVSAMGWIAWFVRHMAALQLLTLHPGKPYAPLRSTAGIRIIPQTPHYFKDMT